MERERDPFARFIGQAVARGGGAYQHEGRCQVSRQPLTPAERGRLGGMKAAERMTPEERSFRAYRGAAGLQDKLEEQCIPLHYHMTRLAMRRRGKKVQL